MPPTSPGSSWALAAGYDVIVEMDADGSHQPEQLPDLLAALTDADVVLGSRWVAGRQGQQLAEVARGAQPRARNAYARSCIGIPLRDATGGYRVYRAEVLRSFDLTTVRSQGYCFQVDLALRSLAARLPRGRGADLFRRARAGRQQDEPRDRARSPVAGHRVGHPRALRLSSRTTPSDLGGRLGLAVRRSCAGRRAGARSSRSCKMTSSSGMLRRSRSMSQWLRGALTRDRLTRCCRGVGLGRRRATELALPGRRDLSLGGERNLDAGAGSGRRTRSSAVRRAQYV